MGGVYCFTLVCSSPEISVAFFMFFSVCYRTVWHGLRLMAHLLPVYQIFIYYSNTYRDCMTFCSQLYRELWKIRASWNLLSGSMWTFFTVNVFSESFLFNFRKQDVIIQWCYHSSTWFNQRSSWVTIFMLHTMISQR